MKKLTYSKPKTRLVAMAENCAIMAASAISGGSESSTTNVIRVASNAGVELTYRGGGHGAARARGISGGFTDFN